MRGLRRFLTPRLALALACLGLSCASGDGAQTPGGADASVVDAHHAPDAPGAPDAHPMIDATPPIDATPAPTAIVSLAPAVLLLSRGTPGMLTVTLDHPAPTGGTVVALASDDTTGAVLTIPAQVTILAGATAASVAVQSVGPGGPLDVRATFAGSMKAASIRVIPALTGITPATADVVVGTSRTYTITLEGTVAAAVDLPLTSAKPGTATVPATVTIPMGASSATFNVTGVALGGPVTITAAAGDKTVTAATRVLGLFLSEIMYDATGTDDTKEWIELYNAAPVPLPVDGVKILDAVGAAKYTAALTLAGTIPAGGCVVVGGPFNTDPTQNAIPSGFVYFVAGAFSPNLGNASDPSTKGPGAGIAIAAADGSIVDDVIYGFNNADLIPDENGVVPSTTDVGDAQATQSIERLSPAGINAAWRIQTTPTPGSCTALSM